MRVYTADGSERAQVLTVNMDDAGSGVSYIGEALPGSATSAAVWRIKKMVESSGDITITWADGDAEFDNVWDNRAALSYS